MDPTTEKTGEAQVASSAASAATCHDVVIIVHKLPKKPQAGVVKVTLVDSRWRWMTTLLDGYGWDDSPYKFQVINDRTSRPTEDLSRSHKSADTQLSLAHILIAIMLVALAGLQVCTSVERTVLLAVFRGKWILLKSYLPAAIPSGSLHAFCLIWFHCGWRSVIIFVDPCGG
jgi:hypothetical protein